MAVSPLTGISLSGSILMAFVNLIKLFLQLSQDFKGAMKEAEAEKERKSTKHRYVRDPLMGGGGDLNMQVRELQGTMNDVLGRVDRVEARFDAMQARDVFHATEDELYEETE